MRKTELHDLVWRRFIRMPYGHLLDYTDENGNTTIPTPEECQNSIPNPMGWWTPIENGAFFGGLYVYALIKEYKLNPSEKLADDINTLIKGLLILQDVGKTEGFIARGVADDGVSHYKCSSEDQVFPWVLGMYAYLNSGLCSDKDDVTKRLLTVINSIWPKDINKPKIVVYECVERGNPQTTGWRAISSMLYCSYVRAILTGLDEDMAHYYKLCEENPDACDFSRIEIISHGFAPEMVRSTSLIQFWIDVSFQIACYELAELDRKYGSCYDTACKHNGYTALQFADDMLKYDNQAGGFSLNWRAISNMAIPFNGDRKEAVQNAIKECDVWNKTVVPHRHMEHKILGDAIYGLWIALMCHDEKVERLAKKHLLANIDKVDWNTLTTSYAFVAESCLILADHVI